MIYCINIYFPCLCDVFGKLCGIKCSTTKRVLLILLGIPLKYINCTLNVYNVILRFCSFKFMFWNYWIITGNENQHLDGRIKSTKLYSMLYKHTEQIHVHTNVQDKMCRTNSCLYNYAWQTHVYTYKCDPIWKVSSFFSRYRIWLAWQR